MKVSDEKIIEAAMNVQNDASIASSVKALVLASAAITTTAKELSAIMDEMRDRQEVQHLLISAVESLKATSERVQRVYDRFIMHMADDIRRSHDFHKPDVCADCLLCEIETKGARA